MKRGIKEREKKQKRKEEGISKNGNKREEQVCKYTPLLMIKTYYL